MFEHKKQPLLSREAFRRRMLSYMGVALAVLLASLGIGVVGYRALENLPWIDALVNASMLLGGMGPVDQLHTVGGKLFASFYALYSGVVFLVAAGLIVTPLFHRFLHHFHIEANRDS
jgi:hypothetical protein